MDVIIITYESELEVDEVESLLRERSQRYREMDGLLQKFYLHDEESGRVGGIYVFDSEESAARLFESDIHSSLRDAYKVRDIDIETYHVMFSLYESAQFPNNSLDTDHSAILDGIATQLDGILKTSEQPVYLYLDDIHKACNEAFASLLGYDSPEEWAGVEENFPTVFVADGSRHMLINAYQAAIQEAVASVIEVTWKKQDGGTVQTEVMLVPVEYAGHRMALHFVTETS